MKYNIQEGLRRMIQMIFGLEIFQFPLLNTLRVLFYRLCYCIGKDSVIESHVLFSRAHHQTTGGELHIGRKAVIARDVQVDFTGSVILGDDVTLSSGTKIFSHSHPLKKKERLKNTEKEVVLHRVEIKDGSWIGANAIILPGVRSIGPNAVVGAGAVVTKDVPPNTVAAGNPARVIRTLDFEY